MQKELALISHHFCMDQKNGYTTALDFWYSLSEKYKINIIVPRNIDIFPDEKKVIMPNVTVRSIGAGIADGKERQDYYFVYYKRLAQDKTLQAKLREAAQNSEIVICDGIFYVSLARTVFPDKTIVYRSLDIELDKYDWACGHLYFEPINPYIYNNTFQFEKKACEDADWIFALTEDDADRLGKLYHIKPEKFRVLPNCYSNAMLAESYIPKKRIKGGRDKALFVSAQAMDDRKSFLAVMERLPDVELHVVGRGGIQLENHPKNVVIHGDVSDAEKLRIASECNFTINVTHMTFGMQAKVKESFAEGIPVLANKEGVRGYHMRAGKDYFPANFDTLEEDIRAFGKLSDEERHLIACSAFHRLCEQFRCSNYFHLIDDLIDDQMDDREKRPSSWYIFGAGDRGKLTLEYLVSHKEKCVGFIDSNTDRQGEQFCGVTIYSPEVALRDIKDTRQKGLVIGTNGKYMNEILQQVVKEVDPENIFIFYDGEILGPECLDPKKIRNLK